MTILKKFLSISLLGLSSIFVSSAAVCHSLFQSVNHSYSTRPQSSVDPLVCLNPRTGYLNGDTESTFKHQTTSIPSVSYDFPGTDDFPVKKLEIKNWNLQDNYLSLSVVKSNDNDWPSTWNTYQQCVDSAYIQDVLNVGLTRDWNTEVVADTNMSDINNVTYQSCQVVATNHLDHQIILPCNLPIFTTNVGIFAKDDDSNINQQFIGCKSEESQIINDSDSWDETSITFVTYLCFVDTSDMTNDAVTNFNPAAGFTNINPKDFTSLSYDGFNPSMKFSHEFGFFLSGYFFVESKKEGIKKNNGWRWNSNLYRYKNIASYDNVNTFKGYYIDTGIFHIIWTDLLEIKFYKGSVITTFSPANLQIWRNDGVEQTGKEWSRALLRFGFKLLFTADNKAKPIADPSSDLDDQATNDFTSFTTTYWWWDKYYGSDFENPTSVPTGTATIQVVNPHDIVDGLPRVMGEITTTIKTL